MTAPGSPPSDPLLELRRIWIDGAEPPPLLDASALRRAAERLRRRVWRRNLTEWGAALVLLPLCAYRLWNEPRPLTRLGMLAIAAAAVQVSATLYRRGRVGRLPETATTAEFSRAHVTALEGQAQLLDSTWRWYLLPFVPGITLSYADGVRAALARSGGSARIWVALLASWVLTWLVFYGIGRLNRRAARDLRREIAALGER
jgi:hypothetical protein